MEGVELLRCPICKGVLEGGDCSLHCALCGTDYPFKDGVPDLVPPGTSDMKFTEREHYTDLIDHYVCMHETWKGSPFYHASHADFLGDLRKLPAGATVLEFGCGLGTDGLELLRSGYRVVETDIAPGSLLEARRLHLEEGFGDSSMHVIADAENLPFADNSFDGAFMVASLHHMADPVQSLREARRTLKPGGIFVIGTEPNSWQHRTLFPVGKYFLLFLYRLLRKKFNPAATVSEADKETEGFSARELRAMFEEAGFSRLELKPAGYLSAFVFFISLELSKLVGRNIKLFPLEKLGWKLDGYLGRIDFLKPYPWHWNGVAYA